MEKVSGRQASASSKMDTETRQDSSSTKTTNSDEDRHKQRVPNIPVGVRNICLVMQTFIDDGGYHPTGRLVSKKFQSLKKYYRDELFKGVLFSLHDNVKLVKPAVNDSTVHSIDAHNVRSEIYIRDPLVFMRCKNHYIALSSAYLKHEIITIFDTVHAIPSCPKIEIMEIDSHMDGGNVIYSTMRQLLLHGNNFAAQFEGGDPRCIQATRELEIKMQIVGVRVIGIDTNIRFYKLAIRRTFFHLDCFMHLLPDERLLVMNKKLLTNESFERLKHEWGDDLIDLACPLTDIKTIPPMNLFSFESAEGTIIISNNVPDYHLT
ncbi:hypothetical protein [Kistimonas scapharcae]|uniref:hypothetical protein n=1 Tax=Kistimonas scapharcae TaxID=1036133 RepID=UPI0031E55462